MSEPRFGQNWSKEAFEAYYRSLDTALVEYMKGNKLPFAAHCAAFGVEHIPDNPIARHAGVLKAITARTSLPMDIRRAAKAQLTFIGMQSEDDGDL